VAPYRGTGRKIFVLPLYWVAYLQLIEKYTIFVLLKKAAICQKACLARLTPVIRKLFHYFIHRFCG
jgi:hypothetical protein